jgi:hypothetical protein
VRVFILASALLVCLASPVLSEDIASQTTEPAGELLPLSPSAILPLQPPLTIEGNLAELESLLDNWETDSQTLWRELQKLQGIVQALRSTLTQSETLCEGLAYSLDLERSKTRSLRRWLIVSSVGGAMLFGVGVWIGASQ